MLKTTLAITLSCKRLKVSDIEYISGLKSDFSCNKKRIKALIGLQLHIFTSHHAPNTDHPPAFKLIQYFSSDQIIRKVNRLNIRRA